MTLWRKLWPPLIPFVLIFLILEVLCQKYIIPSYIFPAPSEVFASLHENSDEYITALLQTFKAAAAGLFFSTLLGVVMAVLLSMSRFVEKAFYPYAVFFQTVPIVSIAPLLVIWFGFGLPTVIVSAFIVSVFPIVANTLSGMRSASTNLVDLFKLYGASKKNILLKLRLPSAVPQILTGVRIASGLSMIGAIVGEFIAGGGLGGLIDMARTQQRLDKVFAAIFIASFLGMFIVSFINLISKLILKRWLFSREIL